ncbi:TSC22 domain family protein 4 [Carlito syrichta]|uniref:TSC22 domain family protein 4 n=1 Tax=Carlito syrichta TaxID=1868482 RepID=A0A3Q0DIB2_CARSF|nr:TSC22 domain family protein 4 [Carlito syrichta]
MSGGKKKSSFQITSVTTDYEGPGSPGGPDSPAPAGPQVESRGPAAGTPPLSRRRDGDPRLRMELAAPEEPGQVPPLDARPTSPGLYFFPDASLVHKSPDFGAAAAQSLSLARTMLAISGHLDSDDDSGSGSLVGIDNKIEQAMDLVKSHLMFAVREEVEVLKEQIRDLAERNAALEQENGLLRALASPEQLAQLSSSGVPRLGPPAPNGPS